MRRPLTLLVCLLFIACEGPLEHAPPAGAITLGERMAARPDPGFDRAVAPREFKFPADHGPHETFATEWWYFTGNLVSTQGTTQRRRFGYQLTLFRIGLTPGTPADDSDWRTHQLYMGHLAISDLENRRHYSAERFSRAAACMARPVVDPWHAGQHLSPAAGRDDRRLRCAADAGGRRQTASVAG